MKKRNIFWIISSLCLVGALLIAFLYNKPPETVEGKDGIPVSAAELVDAYQQDESAANEKYLNKILVVSGVIDEIAQNQDGQTVLFLASNHPLAQVQCTMQETTNLPAEGQMVQIKGFCHGSTLSVLLSGCLLIE